MSTKHSHPMSARDRIQLSNAKRNQAFIMDEGLRSYMLSVYNYMALGVAFTGAIAMLVAMNEQFLGVVASFYWPLLIGVFALGLLSSRIMTNGSVAVGQLCFWAYASCWGLLLGPIFSTYMNVDPLMVPKALFITAAVFAGMSLYGYTSKRNLMPFAGFLVMASLGLLVAIVLNIFVFQDGLFQLLLSGAVVVVFSLLTAVETHAIKAQYSGSDDAEVRAKKAIFGAFSLYGSFVTLFIYILSILGMTGD